ncbi:hypothetical protein PtB15_11B430 [Puccinia triticina]|nr:hypothetical protein PtB15_11B430 [Puccinia triticina]
MSLIAFDTSNHDPPSELTAGLNADGVEPPISRSQAETHPASKASALPLGHASLLSRDAPGGSSQLPSAECS